MAFICGICFLTNASAQTVIPTQTIRAGTILTPDILRQTDQPAQSGAAYTIEEITDLQAKTTLYLNRPVLLSHVGEPELVERNAIITLVFTHGPLEITGEGRALSPGVEGERIRVMNLSSRQTVTGEVIRQNTVRVF